MESRIIDELRERIAELVQRNDLELVDFKFSYHGGNYLLRCIIDYEKGGVTIDKCAEVNKEIFSYLDQ